MAGSALSSFRQLWKDYCPSSSKVKESLVNGSPLKIGNLRATPVKVPLARPHGTASGVVASAPLVLVDLETGQRLAGHPYVLVYPPIALKPIPDLIENLQPVIQGDAVAPLALASKLQGRFRLLGLQGFTRDSHGSDRHCGLGCFGKVSWVVAH